MHALLLLLAACADPASDTLDADGDGFPASEDCDDGDDAVHPGADEACNDADDDCDGAVDEDAAFYPDADGDGYGDATATPSTGACDAPPAGTVDDASDCDDADAAISPLAEEVCDAADTDEDCDGRSDDADDSTSRDGMSLWYPDADADGYGDRLDVGTLACDAPPGAVLDDTDCDDAEPLANPSYAEEVCGDGVDNDCDGTPGACGLQGELTTDDADRVLRGESYGGDGSVAGVGDVNGDGVGDLALGFGREDDEAGAVWVVYGPLEGDAALEEVGLRLVGPAGSWAGAVVAAAGDFNGDGLDDVLVGAPGEGGRDPNGPGGAYVAFGPMGDTAELEQAGAAFVGEEWGDWAGYSVVAAGDVNADGYDDVLVGAPGEDEGHDDWDGTGNYPGSETEAGAAYLVYGPVEGEVDLSRADVKFVGEDDEDNAGYSVAVGDLNADGFPDIVVGAPHHFNDPGWGALYVFYGPVGDEDLDLSMADATILDDDSFRAGYATVANGDMNGDGYADVVLGDHSNDGYDDRGVVSVVFGPVTGAVDVDDADATLHGEDAANAGQSLSVGDVNGDGVADLLIGADGRAYLVYGPVERDQDLATADVKFSDMVFCDGAVAGDLNADGYADVVLNEGDDTWVYYGRPNY